MKLWEEPGVPHKGWECLEVLDLKEEETEDAEVCEMCGQEHLRFVHILRHDHYPEPVRAGCICAGKLTGNYTSAQAGEAKLRNRARRRSTWLTRKWKIDAKGNDMLKVGGHFFLVFQDTRRSGWWKFKFDEVWGNRSYPSQNAAKLALFDLTCEQLECEKEERQQGW